MKVTCPSCGKLFIIPIKDISWLAEAKKRNPKLQIICFYCGRREQFRLDDLERERRYKRGMK